ncbi:MAG: hypothetical protein NC548_36210 [Lachnospiraceae bacterium]|nr:hypothetical protein [Lachnospiraceae bacterium]
MAANTLPIDLHRVLEIGLGGDSFQEFIDHYKEKYDSFEVDGFELEPIKLGYTYNQLVASTGAKTLPAYVDPESPGYEAALRSVEGRSGNIPTQKLFYRFNRVLLREQLQLLQRLGQSAITPEMEDVFMNLLHESSDGLIQSNLNALTHQRHRIVSTGHFVIDLENNPRGLRGIDLDFGIAQDHYDTLTGTARFWTAEEHTTSNEGSKSDPVQYFKNKVKEIRRKYHYTGPLGMELAQDLIDDLLTHSKVLTRIGHSLYPTITDDATVLANAQNENDERLLEVFRKLIRVDAIKARDSYAVITKPGVDENGDPDLVEATIENFNPKNVTFLPIGRKIGGIQGVEPITLGYPAEDVASFLDGRIKLTQRTKKETHSIYIESEMAQLCVPYAIRHMFICTVTA